MRKNKSFNRILKYSRIVGFCWPDGQSAVAVVAERRDAMNRQGFTSGSRSPNPYCSCQCRGWFSNDVHHHPAHFTENFSINATQFDGIPTLPRPA